MVSPTALGNLLVMTAVGASGTFIKASFMARAARSILTDSEASLIIGMALLTGPAKSTIETASRAI